MARLLLGSENLCFSALFNDCDVFCIYCGGGLTVIVTGIYPGRSEEWSELSAELDDCRSAARFLGQILTNFWPAKLNPSLARCCRSNSRLCSLLSWMAFMNESDFFLRLARLVWTDGRSLDLRLTMLLLMLENFSMVCYRLFGFYYLDCWWTLSSFLFSCWF